MFANVNYLVLLAAAVAAWLFGGAYYGVVGEAWTAAQDRPHAEREAEVAARSPLMKVMPFILAFVATFIMAWVFYGVLVHFKSVTVRTGLITAALLWFGFVLTSFTVTNAFSTRKPILTVFDSLHWLGVMLIIGAIVGAWG